MMKKTRVFQTILCIIVLTIVVSCSGNEQIVTSESPESLELTSQVDVITTESYGSQVVASSISELSHFSEIIVVGRFISEEHIINTARNTKDLSEPDPRFFSINQVYQVEVERYIKGDGPKNIYVIQHMGTILLDSNANAQESTPSPSIIDSAIQNNTHKEFEPISMNTAYLMFLRVLDQREYKLDGYSSNQIYSGVAQPWRFRITDENRVVPETIIDNAKYLFGEISLDMAIEQIMKPYDPLETITIPYPPPSSIDQSSPDNSSAYPSP